MKRIVKTTLLICFLFVLGACSNAPPKQVEQQAPEQLSEQTSNIGLLWEIRKSGVASSYLFGTIHSEDPRVTRLPPPVSKAFNAAGNFALEMLLDEATTHTVLKALYFTDGRQLKLLIDKALYAQSVAAMERRGLPESLTNKMKPWGVFTILNMPEQKTGLFLDAILYKSAKTQKKIIVGLETAEEQTAVFDEMPISSQVALLKSTLDHLPNMNQLLDEIIDVYLRRDLHGIVALNEEYETLFDEQLADEFTRRLVIDRNYRMTERMLPLLKKGNSFIAVGALHLAGEEGILNLLTQYDYEVRAVY